MGRLSDEEVRMQLSQACTFVFAAIEHSGIAREEALALGTPEVALARGRVLDYFRHIDIAWLFDEATPAALAQAGRGSANGGLADLHERCRRSARAVGPKRCRSGYSGWVNRCWNEWCCPCSQAGGTAQ